LRARNRVRKARAPDFTGGAGTTPAAINSYTLDMLALEEHIDKAVKSRSRT